ncbi:MAG: DUF1638 domain-containing protein [Pirellulales bacterium]|nr:DUF1638 domain-containing protein [Pirellulales bacterium]
MSEAYFNTLCIACAVFQRELEALRARGDFDLPVQYVDSMLHMRPRKLRDRLDSLLGPQRPAARILLLYGECHAYMNDQESLSGVWRVKGHNCEEILLGTDLYYALQAQKAFVFLPEWTLRWRDVFERELDFHGDLTTVFMKECHAILVYADTGVLPVPINQLEAASEAMGLPWDVVQVGLEPLQATIHEAVERMTAHAG